MRRVVIMVYQQWPLEPQSAPATRGRPGYVLYDVIRAVSACRTNARCPSSKPKFQEAFK
jgi:hypothetical protein